MHARWGVGAGLISKKRVRVLAEAPISILAVHPPAPDAAAEHVPAPRPDLASSPAG